MYLSVFSTFVCLASGALSNSLFSLCKVSDSSCIENTVNNALPKIFNGIPELGVESSDPQFNEIIESTQPMLKLVFLNSTITGYKNCAISNLKFKEDITSVHCDAICQGFNMSGQYIINGSLISLPVEGNGNCKFYTGKFFLTIDTEIEKVKGSDGKTHLVIKDFKITSKPLTPIEFDFHNLFNGQKDLEDAVHKFARENWQEITNLVQYPIWHASLNTVASNVNKYLEHVALEDLLN